MSLRAGSHFDPVEPDNSYQKTKIWNPSIILKTLTQIFLASAATDPVFGSSDVWGGFQFLVRV
jgi:hypothetical protein